MVICLIETTLKKRRKKKYYFKVNLCVLKLDKKQMQV